MNILVLNSGSSSLKCQVLDLPAGRSLAKAGVERVGQEQSILTVERPDRPPVREEAPCPSHLHGIRRVLALLGQDGDSDAVSEDSLRLDAVGHRVVHAGEAYTGSVLIDGPVLAALDACSDLAPLHNPANLAGIRACLEALPGLPQVAVFDNALHAGLPTEVFLYGLPREYHQQHRVRRYGFHGVALRSIVAQTGDLLGRDPAELRLVSLMLGSGCTANAMDRGRSVAVSTGFTPLEGLVQSTRCGDLDPGAVLAWLRAGRTTAELNTFFNRECGLLGLSGVSMDMRDVESAGTAQAELTLAVLAHRLVKYVGGYTADLGGLDALAFGGGIGQNAAELRARVAGHLGHLGVVLDQAANAACVRGRAGVISSPESRIAVCVTTVDEELVIAQDTCELVSGQATVRES